MTSSNSVRRAVRQALFFGAATATAYSAYAAEPADEMKEVVVTGSRIRRVDAETASPVFVIDDKAIQQSGVQTVGDLMNRIPAVAGAAVNPQVNNGGGFGEANIELRGLDAKRTLILLNGRRIGLVGNSGAVDINMIPISIIERVEVLKEGAGAVYGSDAIAGVVNFITRKNVEGLEIGGQFGRTTRSDGQHYSIDLLWGANTDKLNFTVGGSYTNQEQVSANNRDFSRFALYLYSGVVSAGGSSRIPTGRVFLPAGNPVRTALGCSSVTRIAGTSGASTANYRCYTGADAYNYQPFNLLLTPQERGSVFSTLNYKVNDNVETYAEVLMNRTHSGFQIAPLPFDATADDTIVAANNIYNPFGIAFGGFNNANPNLRARLEALGNRQSDTTSDSKVINFGARGKILNTGWEWDIGANYARLDQGNHVTGYLFKPDLAKALGPSFYAGPGNTNPTCGTVAAPISGCIPLNIFNVTSPATLPALQALQTDYSTDGSFITEGFAASITGSIAPLPAGPLQTAFGIEYKKLEGKFFADHLVVATPPLFISCLISQEACTGNSSGDYNVKEVFVEALVPILKGVTGAEALNFSVGARYSDYSLFGNKTRAQFKIEYRPIQDLLIRGTYAQVFRVPTITDVFGAPAISNPTFADPCLHLTQAQVTANPNLAFACQFVVRDGSFAGDGTSQITSVITSNRAEKPETGSVITYGFVYDASWAQGLSFNVDFWRYKIDDLITNVDTNYSMSQCVQTGSPYFCGLITRYSAGPNAGRIAAFVAPTANLGTLETRGVDIGVKYALRNTPAGNFQFTLDTTKFTKYDNTPAPGTPTQEILGTYDQQFGNIAEWRALLGIGWSMSGFEALLTGRYVHSLEVPHADGADPFNSPSLPVPSVTTFDLSAGYEIEGTKTRLQIGVQNVTDKQPPLLYQNNVINANTDVSTYDSLGRRWFVSFKQKF